MADEIVEIYVASGQAEANLVKSYLEANGIEVMAVQEGAGEAYGLSVGVLGEVRLWVQSRVAAQAKALIRAMERGELENGGDELGEGQA